MSKGEKIKKCAVVMPEIDPLNFLGSVHAEFFVVFAVQFLIFSSEAVIFPLQNASAFVVSRSFRSANTGGTLVNNRAQSIVGNSAN